MERTIYKPSTYEYDQVRSIDEVLERYREYISLLSDEDLKGEYENIRSAWLNRPTVMNVRMFEIAKSKMLKKGFISTQTSYQADENEKGF